MQISVNLASKPFVELGPLYAQLRMAMAALAVVAVGVGATLHVETAKANAAQAQMDALKAQTAHYETQLSANEARMRQPQNRAVLDRAQFLNRLFAQKSFSWTAVMMDLEHVLPAGVQVTSIEPFISKEGDVSIRMRVSGDRDRAVELVRNLEASQRFLKPTLTSESMETTQANGRGPAQGEGVPGGVEFDILSGYNPLPMREKKTPDAEKAGSSEEAATKHAAAPAKAPVVQGAKAKNAVRGGAR